MRIRHRIHNTKRIFINLRKLLKISWEMDPRLTFAFYFTSLIGALSPVVGTVTLKYLLDNLYAAQTQVLSAELPTIIITILGGRYLLLVIMNLIRNGLNRTYFDHAFRNKIQNRLNYMFYEKVSGLDIAQLEDPRIQDSISRVKDTMNWRLPDLLKGASYFFEHIVAYISAFLLLLPFGAWIPFVITLANLPRLYLRMRFGNVQWSIYGRGAPGVKKIYYLNQLLSSLTSIKEIRILKAREELLRRLKETQERLFKLNMHPVKQYLKALPIPPLFESVVLFFIVYLQVPGVLAGTITIGTLILIINMIDQLNSSSAGAVGELGTMYENSLYTDYFYEIYDLPKLVREKPQPITFSQVTPPSIEFKNVSFQYPGGLPVLKGISFTVPAGSSLALVGQNGAGKSTIIKLICRFYDATSGEILVNGVNIKDLSLANLYEFMGTLFQDFVHYYFTVKDNILLGSNSPQDKTRIEHAARQSGASAYIERLPNKYEQMLGREYETGVELSVGQWQKLSLTRAFYRASPLLILDEPTSAIDAEAEYEIFSNLEKVYKGNTLIVVSHRFSTVRNTDQIIVIDQGRIIERGDHEELMQQNGSYAKMFRLQAEGYLG